MLKNRFRQITTLLLSLSILVACERTDLGGEATSEPVTNQEAGACLQGNWVMSNEDVNSLMTSVAPVPGLSVPTGTLVMAFTSEDFSYGSDNLTVRMEMPGG